MLRALLAVGCLLAVPSWAMAQDEAFKQGLEARGDRKWPDVVRHMQNAIKSDPQEAPRKVRSGLAALVGAGTEYLPHFFLGEAYYNQGDCGGAVTEWLVSEQQGAIKSRPESVGIMQKGLKACAAKGVLLAADYTPLYTATRQAYVDASALAKKVSDLGTTNREVWRAEAGEQYERANKELSTSLTRFTAGQRSRLASDFNESKAASERAIAILRPLESSVNAAIEALSSTQRLSKEVEQTIAGAEETNNAIEALKSALTDAMQNTRKSGREQLTQARDRLTVGQKTQNPAAVGEALKYAQSASTLFAQVLDQAKKVARGAFEQQFGEAIRAADEAFSRISSAITTLDKRSSQRPDVVQPEMTSTRTSLEKQIGQLLRRFDRARKAEDLASLAETTRLAAQVQVGLDTLIGSFGPLTLRDRGVVAPLEEGARLYLGGEYQQALSALEPLVGQSDVPLRIHAHVFRAASLYALFVRSGESNQQLRTQALAEIAQSKQLNSSFQPSAKVFGPRFLGLYQTGGATSESGTGATAQQ
jgi:hypothetical protein